MASEPTLFMRIHKTAGEALAKQLCARLPSNAICPEQFEYRVRGLQRAELLQYRFFEGHISPSALSEVFSKIQTFTMLRDPSERLLSCFFYWKEGSKRVRGEFFDAIANLSLLEFLRSENPIIRRVTWNVQARLLAGGQFGGIDPQRQNVFGPWLSEPDLVVEAVRGLDRFAFVGTTERYEMSLHKACELLELGEPPPPERINVTPSGLTSYDQLLAIEEISDALSRLTHADRVVYDAACKRLDENATAAGFVRSSQIKGQDTG
jgi:hypothetical protein